MRSTLHKAGQVMMSAAICTMEALLNGLVVLASIAVGLDIRHTAGGAATLSGSACD